MRCTNPHCTYEEPHNHGFACSRSCHTCHYESLVEALTNREARVELSRVFSHNNHSVEPEPMVLDYLLRQLWSPHGGKAGEA